VKVIVAAVVVVVVVVVAEVVVMVVTRPAYLTSAVLWLLITDLKA